MVSTRKTLEETLKEVKEELKLAKEFLNRVSNKAVDRPADEVLSLSSCVFIEKIVCYILFCLQITAE